MKQGVAVGFLALAGVAVIGAVAIYSWPAREPVAPPSSVSREQPTSQAGAQTAPPAGSQQAVQLSPPGAARPSGVPDFDVVRVRPDGQTVMAGRADPGASVTVLDGEKVFATVTADAHGEWVLMPDKALMPGSHELSLTENSPGGGPVQKSANIVVVSVPEPKQGASGEAAQPLAVLVPRQGEGAAKTLQMPPVAAPAGPPSGATAQISVIQYDSAGHLSVSGRAAPDERVLLYIENKPVGDARADANGDWSVKPSDTVAAGSYALRMDSIGKDDKVAARAQLQFRRVEVPKALADSQFLVVQPGDTLWRIARRTYGEGLLFTDIYHANRSEIVDPNLIYPGQVVALPPG
jgi:nucleoid-associated protein YgaU